MSLEGKCDFPIVPQNFLSHPRRKRASSVCIIPADSDALLQHIGMVYALFRRQKATAMVVDKRPTDPPQFCACLPMAGRAGHSQQRRRLIVLFHSIHRLLGI
ncbi:hypothetical protein DdX_09275 [Ditylenchus destructor]|uniref:Uncharacterized protein n=1 Tax=Ditylenchus destructor TaxID=166010 RepID=A0AAD4N6R7_9BILA|nr:hypothetical protein DdX_09275 [Ditylenchus destructor]